MQVSVEATKGLERRMKVAVPAERVEKEVENRLKSLSRTAKLAGFRPGKVPMRVITSKFGPQVRKEVLDEVTQRSFQEAVHQEKLQLAGRPQIEFRPSASGQDFEYTAVFEVYPGIKLAPLSTIKIEKPVAEITEADVDNMLEKMRKQRIEWQPAARAAQLEDQLVVDFRGTINGVDFQGNTGNNIAIVLGSKAFIEDFEQQLIGVKAGDETTVNVTFPDNYQAKNLAGQRALFEVKVHSVSEPRMPEIDAEFIRSFECKADSLEGFRQEVREGMTVEMEQVLKDLTKSQVMDQLYSINPLELPKALLEAEIANLMKQTRDTLKSHGAKVDEVTLSQDMFEERARRRVSVGLLMADIVKNNNFKVQASKVREAIEKIASTYDDPAEVISWYYADRSRLGSIESLVLEDQVIDLILTSASITENKMTFDDVMKRRQA